MTAPKTSRIGLRRAFGAMILALAAVLPLTGSALPAPAAAAPTTMSSESTRVVPAAGPEINDPGVEELQREYGLENSWAYPFATFDDNAYRIFPRWNDGASGFYTKFDGFSIPNAVDSASRNLVESPYLSTGHSIWGFTGMLTRNAVSFDAISSFGGYMDIAGGTFVNTLFRMDGNPTSNPAVLIIVVLVLVLIVVTIVRSVGRGAGLIFRRVGSIFIIFGILFGMTINAAGTIVDQENGSYRPSPLTPGWVVKTMNDSISYLSDSVATALVTGIEGIGGQLQPNDRDTEGLFDCRGINDALWGRLETMATWNSRLDGAQAKTIARVMDAMWATTGLETWKRSQLGHNNPYADATYCHLLDIRSTKATPWGAFYALRHQVAAKTGDGTFLTYIGNNTERSSDVSIAAPFNPMTDKDVAAVMVWWAACKATAVNGSDVTWAIRDGWSGYAHDGHTLTAENAPEECQKGWVSQKGGSNDNFPDIFDVSGDSGWISDASSKTQNPAAVSDYLRALTGVGAAGNVGGAQAYVAGSIFGLASFGYVDLISFLANLALAGFIFLLWFVLISALMSESPFKERIGKALNQVLGLAIFASMITVIIGLVVTVTRLLILIGDTMFGRGSFFQMIWTGIAPVIALVGVHFFFKKVLKLPSPVSVGGATAWGKAGASGAIGAGAMAGIGSGLGSFAGMRSAMNSFRRGANMVRNATGRGRGGTGGTGRRSAMDARSAGMTDKQKVAADKAKATQQQRERVKASQEELRAARDWKRETTGATAAGDTAAYRERLARKDSRKGLRELRTDFRQQIKQARKNGDEELAGKLREKQLNTEGLYADREQMRRQNVSGAARAFAAVRDLPAAAANRAALGVRSAAATAWNTPVAGISGAVAAGVIRSEAKVFAQSRGVQAAARGAQFVARGSRSAHQLLTQRTQNNRLVAEYRAAQAGAAERAAAARTAAAEEAQRARQEAAMAAQQERMGAAFASGMRAASINDKGKFKG